MLIERPVVTVLTEKIKALVIVSNAFKWPILIFPWANNDCPISFTKLEEARCFYAATKFCGMVICKDTSGCELMWNELDWRCVSTIRKCSANRSKTFLLIPKLYFLQRQEEKEGNWRKTAVCVSWPSIYPPRWYFSNPWLRSSSCLNLTNT